MNDEVLDAMEDILRQQGVFDEMKKTLYLSVASVVKKQLPIQTNSKAKEFGATTDGEFVRLMSCGPILTFVCHCHQQENTRCF